MSDLPMIKTGAGWVLDVSVLDVGDLLVIQADQWPPAYAGMMFRQTDDQASAWGNNVYHVVVTHKPNTGMTVAQFNKPAVAVFKKEPSHE